MPLKQNNWTISLSAMTLLIILKLWWDDVLHKRERRKFAPAES